MVVGSWCLRWCGLGVGSCVGACVGVSIGGWGGWGGCGDVVVGVGIGGGGFGACVGVCSWYRRLASRNPIYSHSRSNLW